STRGRSAADGRRTWWWSLVKNERRAHSLRGVDDPLQLAKQRARLARRRVARTFGARVGDQPRQRVGVRRRIGGNERLQAVGLAQHAIAPPLEPRELLSLPLRALRPGTERVAQRLGIDVAHQSSDVLHLPTL